MGRRRDGREAAVQFLYQLDLNGRALTVGVEDFWSMRSAPGAAPTARTTQAYTDELVSGVCSKLEEIDARLQTLAANYELHRIAAVDRNILRLAIYEMVYCPDVPPVVAINEAIEIAKRFGTEESGRFVNGILDRLRSELPRAPREAQGGPRRKGRQPSAPAGRAPEQA